MESSDIKKIKDLLLPELRQMFKEEMAESHQGLSDQITDIKKDVEGVKQQVAPISKVYTSFNGFGSVVAWGFKYVIIPVSVIIGILATYNSLKK